MFKDRLNEALAFNDMKAIELAERMGVTRGTISQYMSGRCVPKGERVHRMASILGVRDEWLLGYDVPMLRSPVSEDQADEILRRIRSLSPEHQKIILSFLQTLSDQEGSRDL